MLMELPVNSMLSTKPADPKQDGQELDLQDFQAKLETSLGNIQAMVESWLPKELQTIHQPASDQSKRAFELNSSRPRNSKLGLGSVAPKHTQSQLSTSKLHSQLTKKPKKDGEAEAGEFPRPSLDRQTESEENDEDSRTTCTFGKKRSAPNPGSSSFDLLQPPTKVHKPSSSANTSQNAPMKTQPAPADSLLQTSQLPANAAETNPANLSKRQRKKMRKLERARLAAATTPAS